ncbi:T-cell surface glycoprotein CD8 alpha chain-like [Egretta garzetta]|uniref:T-cell surface glycoprotein CD8 alpha chain-like n=1 Tax=Egretta garzetta TaxID=188379 RepID=UPI00163D338C|nr:T-cell surface glycoprotein CD8 alpha chain-like [Egretta garzetta]
MAGSPALLLLLALGLCCPGIWGQRYKMTPQRGQRLELQCHSDKEDSGVSWVRQDKDGTLHFIVFISSLGRTTFERNEGTATRFEARKDNSFYRLVVKSFMTQDEGNYFCLMNSNQMLYFSPGQPAFFPGQQHLYSTLLSSAKMPSTRSPCLFTSDEKYLNSICGTFIWVLLAGACILLLMALVVTIVLWKRKSHL